MTRSELEQQLDAPPTWEEVEQFCRKEGIRGAAEQIKRRRLDAMLVGLLDEQKRLLSQSASKPGHAGWWNTQQLLTDNFETFDILNDMYDERLRAEE